MGCEVPVALLLVILLHLLESASYGRGRRVEYPSALRTTPALEIRSFFCPDEFTTHARRIPKPLKKGEDIGFI